MTGKIYLLLFKGFVRISEKLIDIKIELSALRLENRISTPRKLNHKVMDSKVDVFMFKCKCLKMN